jgi:SAM-dependent methyltransferase
MNLEWESRACPICNSTAERKVVAESNIDGTRLTAFAFSSRKYPEYMHPRMVQCAQCGLIYANPALALGCIEAAYEGAAFDSAQEAAFASDTYAKLVANRLGALGSLNRALDIGTGDGSFLERLLGFGFRSVTGIEPSAAPIANAKLHIRRMIRQDVFRASDFEPEQFDLVTCFQVMEHLWDPAQLVLDVISLLRSGGLFLAVVHDVNALSARVLRTKSPIFDIEHLQLFSPKTITELLRRSGFIELVVIPVWNYYPLHYWLKLSPLPPRTKEWLIKTFKHGRFGNIPFSLPAGNIAVLGWKPR